MGLRLLHSNSRTLGYPPKIGTLNPYWVTGFTDAEGSFSCIIAQRPSGLWKISLSFEINLHTKDIGILYALQSFFGCGNVTSRPARNLSVFRVTRLDDIIFIIIPHFLAYPLYSQKQLDFYLWKFIAIQMKDGIHLTLPGFISLLPYYASIHLGVSNKVSQFFTNIIPAVRGIAILPKILNPYWVSGFVAGDGGFNVGIRSTGQIFYSLSISQHIRDLELMYKFIDFFGCGSVYPRPTINRCDYSIQSAVLINSVVIPHFDQYPLCNIKDLDYQDFKLIMTMVGNSTAISNITVVRTIISRMNSKRKFG